MIKSHGVDDDDGDDDDDPYIYFLQPSSTPYDIKEKIKQANIDLMGDSNEPTNKEKIRKVDFESNLETIIYSPKKANGDHLNNAIKQVPLPHSGVNVKSDDNINCNKTINLQNESKTSTRFDFPMAYSKGLVFNPNSANINCKETESDNKYVNVLSKGSVNRTNKSPTKKIASKSSEESLTLQMNKMNLNNELATTGLSNSVTWRRKCCSSARRPHSLPHYNGHYSEYGMSFDMLERRKQLYYDLKKHRDHHQKLVKQYQSRCYQQNEEIFKQWLHTKSFSGKLDLKHNFKMCSFSQNEETDPSSSSNEHYAFATPKFIPKLQVRKNRRPQSSPFAKH